VALPLEKSGVQWTKIATVSKSSLRFLGALFLAWSNQSSVIFNEKGEVGPIPWKV
jgi:hypothetical protein